MIIEIHATSNNTEHRKTHFTITKDTVLQRQEFYEIESKIFLK